MVRPHASLHRERPLDALLRVRTHRDHRRRDQRRANTPHERHGARYGAASSLSSVFSRTFAPLVMSAGRENSFGAWLIPPMLGMKIMPIGQIWATSCASCPAPLGMLLCESPSSVADAATI